MKQNSSHLEHHTCLETRVCGTYPVALRDAKILLVEEQERFVPMYRDGISTAIAESAYVAATGIGQCGDAKDILYEEDSAIFALRKDLFNVVLAMREHVGDEAYCNAILLSMDLVSRDPAIKVSTNPDLSFELQGKKFDLGLTGRLLEDESGQVFNERLFLQTSIYDSFDLARAFSPKRIYAVDANGFSATTIYEDAKEGNGLVGPSEEINKGKYREARDVFLHPEERRVETQREVLSTGGLKIHTSQIVSSALKDHPSGPILFGTNYKNQTDFLNEIIRKSEYLYWRLDLVSDGENTCFNDWNGLYDGRINAGRNVLGLDLGQIKLHWDHHARLNVVFSLGNELRDLWMDPDHRCRDMPSSEHFDWNSRKTMWMDIVYDVARKITPDCPVLVKSKREWDQYLVVRV